MQQIDLLMTSDQKKTFLLLKAIIFQHHGLNEEESQLLLETAHGLGAFDELQWVNNFVAVDVYTAFERSRAYLNELTDTWDSEVKLHYLAMVWESVNNKGHITEMEAVAMLKIAKDWKIQRELMLMVRKK